MGSKARVVSKNWSRRSEGDRACRSRKSGSPYANNRGGEEVGLHAVVIAAAVVVVGGGCSGCSRSGAGNVSLGRVVPGRTGSQVQVRGSGVDRWESRKSKSKLSDAQVGVG